MGELVLLPEPEEDDEDFSRYFVPEAEPDMSARGMGQYANDLAFKPGMGRRPAGEEEYWERAAEKNGIQLVWRMEQNPKRPTQLVPSWPVCVLSRDMTFTNTEPMELGCTYGWHFWGASAQLQGERSELPTTAV